MCVCVSVSLKQPSRPQKTTTPRRLCDPPRRLCPEVPPGAQAQSETPAEDFITQNAFLQALPGLGGKDAAEGSPPSKSRKRAPCAPCTPLPKGPFVQDCCALPAAAEAEAEAGLRAGRAGRVGGRQGGACGWLCCARCCCLCCCCRRPQARVVRAESARWDRWCRRGLRDSKAPSSRPPASLRCRRSRRACTSAACPRALRSPAAGAARAEPRCEWGMSVAPILPPRPP